MGTEQESDRTESDLARAQEFSVTLHNGELYTFNLHDVTWINHDDLAGEVDGQPQRYAFYALIHVGVKDAIRVTRSVLSSYVASASAAVRAELGKGATETHIKQVIATRERHKELQARLDKLEGIETRVGIVRESLTQRRDMLQSAVMLAVAGGGASIAQRAARAASPRYTPKA